MELGNFSVSLSVKDLSASRAFYEKLGFAPGRPGDAGQRTVVAVTDVFAQGIFDDAVYLFLKFFG